MSNLNCESNIIPGFRLEGLESRGISFWLAELQLPVSCWLSCTCHIHTCVSKIYPLWISGLCGSCTKWRELWKCKECFSWLFTKTSHMLGPDEAPDPAHAQTWWKWHNLQFFLLTWWSKSSHGSVVYAHVWKEKPPFVFQLFNTLTPYLFLVIRAPAWWSRVFLRHLKMFKFKSGKSQSRNICSPAPSHNHGSSYWPQEINMRSTLSDLQHEHRKWFVCATADSQQSVSSCSRRDERLINWSFHVTQQFVQTGGVLLFRRWV